MTNPLRSDWNGRMIGSVRLVAPRPAGLANARTPGGGWYRDLELDSWLGRYEGVGGQQLERGAYLTTEVQVLWQVADGALPTLTEVPPAGRGRHALALACVEAIVGEFNRQIRPLIEAVES